MSRSLLLALVALLLPAFAQAQVYKCTKPGGGTIYADAPCGGGAMPIRIEPVQPVSQPSEGTQQRTRDVAPRTSYPQATASPSQASQPTGTGYCPSPLDLKNLETAASSHDFHRRYREKQFLLEHVSYWRGCNPESSKLTPPVWKQLQEAYGEQTANDPAVRDRAKRRASELLRRL